MLTFLGFLIVFLLMYIAYTLRVIGHNHAKVSVAESIRHSETVLLLRGVKSILAEIADADKV